MADRPSPHANFRHRGAGRRRDSSQANPRAGGFLEPVFAKEFHAEVTLLHVVEKTAVGSGFADVPSRFAYLDEELSIAKKNLRALTASSQEAGCPTIGSTVRTGLPAHEIVEAAKESNTDLIVIATHGYTGWKHFCIGSTAERVVRAAPCPVFVVREKEHDFV
jgi:universal stress protein A